MKKLLLLLTLFLTPLLGSETVSLLDNLQKAEVGDYIVTSQNKCITVLFLRQKSGNYLIFDEVTTPMGKITSWKNWNQWIDRHAPGHTSWLTYSIDLSQAKLTHTYSQTLKQWIRMEPSQQILSTLLNIQLEKIPSSKRKRRGSSASQWSPPLTFEGELIRGVPFSAWVTHWPMDGSELAGQEVVVYLPEKEGPYPTYFPYWIQVQGSVNRATIRIIDSGKGLHSPMTNPFVS